VTRDPQAATWGEAVSARDELRPFHVFRLHDTGWSRDGEVLARDLSGAGESALLLRRWSAASWTWPNPGVLEARAGRGAFRVVDPQIADAPA
jgi:hypothetical protein